MEAALHVFWMMGATLFCFLIWQGTMTDLEVSWITSVSVSSNYVNKIYIGPGISPTPLSPALSTEVTSSICPGRREAQVK